MTSFIRNGGPSPLYSGKMDIPKDILRKAAESALIRSFVDLNLRTPLHVPTTSTRTRKISTKGKGHQSQKVVIEVDLSQRTPHPNTSIFVKAIPSTSMRALTEVKFYSQIVPELYQTPALKYPRSAPTLAECSHIHEDHQQSLIFLENLKVMGFKNCGPAEETEFDFNHALLAVETLARFHAQSYFLIRQLGGRTKGRMSLVNRFPFLQPGEHTISPSTSTRCGRVYANFFDHIVLRIVEAETPSLAFKMRRKYPYPESLHWKLWDTLENERHSNPDLFVICHGDFRTDNLLFKYGVGKGVEPGEAIECRMIDMKNVILAPLASDLVYFMFTSLNARMRQDFEEKLIAFYCDSFESQLSIRYRQERSEMKPEDFDIESFHRHVEDQYHRMLEFGFFSSVTALPLIFNGFSGVVENLTEIHLDGVGQGYSLNVLESLEKPDKFMQFANECLANKGLKEAVLGVVQRLAVAKIL